MDSPRTKNYVDMLNNLKLNDKRVLVILPGNDKNVVLSARNVQKNKVVNAIDINTYDVVNAASIVLTQSSISILESNLLK
jgi:large subunit ribosomal protein L4